METPITVVGQSSSLRFQAFLIFVIAFIAGGILGGLAVYSWFSDQQNQPIAEEGVWLTVSTELVGEQIIFLEGVDLSDEVRRGLVHTYLEPGTWFACQWDGYVQGRNACTIPKWVKTNYSNWQELQPTVDFWWAESRGDYPPGARPGTSSQ